MEEGKQERSFLAVVTAYSLATLMAFSFVGYCIFSQDKIISIWPAAAGLYEMVGLKIEIPGEGLVIEKLDASIRKRGKQDLLLIRGNVINLRNKSIDVPPIQATLRGEDDEIIESWVIEPPVDILDSDADFEFKSVYRGLPQEATSVNLAFVVSLYQEDLTENAEVGHEKTHPISQSSKEN